MRVKVKMKLFYKNILMVGAGVGRHRNSTAQSHEQHKTQNHQIFRAYLFGTLCLYVYNSMWKIQKMSLEFRKRYLGKEPSYMYLKSKYSDYVNNTIIPNLRTIKNTRVRINLN